MAWWKSLQKRDLALSLAGVATVLAIVVMVTPWWTAHITGSFSYGTFNSGPIDDDQSAGPFDKGGSDETGELISEGKALAAGLLTLVALVAILAGTLLMLIPRFVPNGNRPLFRAAPLAWALGALLLILEVILAVATWPPEGSTFWDSSSSSGVKTSVYASLGWYAALVTAVLALGALVLGWGPATAAGAVAPAAIPASSPPPAPPAIAAPSRRRANWAGATRTKSRKN